MTVTAINPNSVTTKSVRTVLAGLTEYGARIPESAAAAVAELERVEQLKPAEANRNTLVALFLNADTTSADVEAHAAAAAGQQRALEAWKEAIEHACRQVMAALSSSADEIIEDLREQAEDAIEDLVWYANNGSPDVAALVREGRTDDAARAARVEVSFATLTNLATIRSNAIGQSALGRAGLWPDPTAVRDSNGSQIPWSLAAVVRGVELNVEPWWPTVAQARAAHAGLVKAEKEALKEEADRVNLEKQLGHYVSMI